GFMRRLPFRGLTSGRQATCVAGQMGGLVLAVIVCQDLTVSVVGEALASAVRVVDAQHFAAGLALQRGGV
ncbi:hypothetical protein ALP82_02932, partial [Pseudomonas savastanoi pv. fraxini]